MSSSLWPHHCCSGEISRMMMMMVIIGDFLGCVSLRGGGDCCSLSCLCAEGLLRAGWIVCPQVTVWITWLIVFQLLINWGWINARAIYGQKEMERSLLLCRSSATVFINRGFINGALKFSISFQGEPYRPLLLSSLLISMFPLPLITVFMLDGHWWLD